MELNGTQVPALIYHIFSFPSASQFLTWIDDVITSQLQLPSSVSNFLSSSLSILMPEGDSKYHSASLVRLLPI